MNQDIKARIAPQVKSVLAKYGIKGTLRVRDHMTLVLNIRQGRLDFVANCNRNTLANYPGSVPAVGHVCVNRYHVDRQFDGVCRKCIQELLDAMNQFNWDRSDIQSDHFDVGYYVDINIGLWNNPYVVHK